MEKIGRYELRGEIGRGGMATVYRAFDPQTNREVAIKLLPSEMMHNLEFRARFAKELKIISALEHVSIVPVYDSGEEAGRPFFVMRYMKGGSLQEWLKRGPLSLQDTAVIVERLALGLDYAHKRGIIHRDLKPDNILFDDNDNPCLSDFGIAKLTETGGGSTSSGTIGTPAYISPEQSQSLPVDHRADIYGLGVILYEMLTGKKPYQADNAMGVLVKHISDPVPEILKENPRLPASLDVIIKKAMAKKREDRYQSVLEFSRALSVAAFGEERTLPAALVLERKQKDLTRKRTGFMVAGVLSLILLSAGYFSLPFLSPTPTATPTLTATSTSLPSITPSIVPPSATPSLTATITATATATSIPTPLGGAREIALLTDNKIIQIHLNEDGSDPVTLNGQNFEKSNLQWLDDGRLIYLYPPRCADIMNGGSDERICFQENLSGFRVSPDGTRVAISVNNTLYIVPFKSPFRESSWKGEYISKDHLATLENACRYLPSIKDVLWSKDGKRVAALVVDPRQNHSEQIHVFSVTEAGCNPRVAINPSSIDEFPGNIFVFDLTRGYKIPSYDWDGDHRFLLNNKIRNELFGYLYLYDSNTGEISRLEPLGACCYADARWSPDGNNILFRYQNDSEDDVHLYYILLSEMAGGGEWEPIRVPRSINLQTRKSIYPVWQLAK